MPTASRVRCRDESAGSNNSDTIKRSSSKKKQKTSSSSNKKLSATAAAAAKAGVGSGDIDGFYTVEKIVDHRVDKKTGTTTYIRCHEMDSSKKSILGGAGSIFNRYNLTSRP